METLVMSQAAPGIRQHPYHHMMVGGDAHHDEADEVASTQRRQGRTAPIPTPQTSSSNNTQHHDSQHSAHSRQHSYSSRPPPPSSTYSQQSINNHGRGFDQAGYPLSNDPRILQSSPASPRLGPTFRSTRSLGGSEATSPSRIKVRDLSHIQSFASEEYLARPRLGNRTGSFEAGRQYEISSMPVTDIIEMVAGLLTKITTTNDRQHEHLHRPAHTQEQGGVNTQTSCVLAFHGKNVPSITILSYLSRIHKYCPTTYEVFLSLLVYFDRMTENFNRRYLSRTERSNSGTDSTASSETIVSGGDEPRSPTQTEDSAQQDLPQYFVVDSFNIHRLVIAGVTCASKFFSDVFYTNSRYAKVRQSHFMSCNFC